MNELEDRLFSTRACPEVQYLVIPKCGCTYVKNLLWRIDHDGYFPNPSRVHDADSEFPRAGAQGYSAEKIRENPYAFTVLRNPVDRFLSLYFDKVIGDGYKRFVPLRDVLTKSHGVDVNADSVEGHRRNCMILLDWIEANLRGDSELPHDPHWTPQGWRMDIIKAFDLKILMLANIETRLKLLLHPLLTDIGRLVDGIERNRSQKPVSRADLVHKELHDRIAAVYDHDMWLTHMAWKYWEEHKPQNSESIPRMSQIVSQ